MVSSALPQPRHSLLDRAMRPFSVVRPGEAATALILTLNIFLILAGYYLLKPVREALILAESGAVVKSYAAAGQAALLLIVVPLYGLFGTKVNRTKLVCWVTVFFISNLAVFYALGGAGYRLGVPFYLWLGIFNNFIVAQFWAFSNDLYTEEQGKRLFPIVGIGMSLGAWAGAETSSVLFRKIGIYPMMLCAAGTLVASVALTIWASSRQAATSRTQKSAAAEPLGTDGGFRLVLRHRYLLLIAILILLLNIVNTTGEFLLGKLVQEHAEAAKGAGDAFRAARGVLIGEFYGDFYGYVNLLGFLLQTFLASRIFRYMGVRGALFILPAVALGGYSLLLAYPLLQAVRVAKILENSIDYSIMNTTRHALFLPTSREAKYKAKAAIDTFVVRTGDMLQAGIVYAGVSLGFQNQTFAGLCVALVLVWIGVAALIFGEHRRLTTPKTASAS
jgi:AAA family ATP:ADP antiporter